MAWGGGGIRAQEGIFRVIAQILMIYKPIIYIFTFWVLCHPCFISDYINKCFPLVLSPLVVPRCRHRCITTLCHMYESTPITINRIVKGADSYLILTTVYFNQLQWHFKIFFWYFLTRGRGDFSWEVCGNLPKIIIN